MNLCQSVRHATAHEKFSKKTQRMLSVFADSGMDFRKEEAVTLEVGATEDRDHKQTSNTAPTATDA